MSVEEIYNKLRNDREFIEKLAEALADKVVVQRLEELSLKVEKLAQEQIKLGEEFNQKFDKLNSEVIGLNQKFDKLNEKVGKNN
ncbi:hypothetical protein GWK48_09805 [Metallosphaera tengchongensis]|uniref:Uncharacterized protein n=1 Tax=Metallosphaera tengchongensis TaxID=1532350 RepID=A0A6N0NZ45_9CREN|nr:hypothetical protein [Metallosphaera tengchongensis]QKR00638.1 hypothetical protein GWK48_09805 [Metallosphaera tengchongensis]